MSRLAAGAVSLLALSLAAAVPGPDGRLAAQPRGVEGERRIVLTFDDAPMTGPGVCERERVRYVTEGLTGFLAAEGLPSAVLVSGGRECVTPGLLRETLERWRAIGAAIGNHTATHPDIDDVPLGAYLADLDRGQALIDAAVATDARWFRPPYLHTGEDRDRKEALLEHLDRRGYRMAPVTVDNQEWVYAALYERAKEGGDEALAGRLAVAYLEHLEECVAFYEGLSVEVLGREVPQVLLLHANVINADRLEEVVGMLRRRGYTFAGLAEALEDPAYARADPYVGPRGISWLQRWALGAGVAVGDEPREADWVAELFRASRWAARRGSRDV